MKYALITGASRGIGKGIALALAKAGYNLILTCRQNKDDLLAVATQAKEYGSSVYTYVGDISNTATCEDLFSFINNNNISIDVLINNAGISYVGLLQDMSYEEWNNCINTNLSSIFYTCKHCIPQMLQKKQGHIINISSVWGNAGASCEVAYSASKGGVNAFTKALAKELAPSGIQVNAIAFGLIDTDMNAHLTDEDKKELANEIPMGRAGSIEDAGQMVLSILSSPAYMTGQIISMDGGWL
ncbi:MAG: SDR family oxidoreductase [Lachnospiraceae bacterium]|nr:SDR family oxidoreductase [Lachnospiraceae bacterium]